MKHIQTIKTHNCTRINLPIKNTTNTTLLRELEKFNDIPITKEDLEDISLQDYIKRSDRKQEKVVIAQTLRKVGIDIYADNSDEEDYC
jgi:hypothetical protein